MLSIQGVLSVDDHAALMRELNEPRRTRVRLVVGGLGVAIAGASALAGPILPLAGFGFDAALPLGAALALNALVASPLRFRRTIRRQFAELVARSQTSVDLDVGEEGLTSRDARNNPVFIPWANLLGWRPRPWGVVVFLSRDSALIVPNRWISAEQRADLDKLLDRLRRI